MCGKNCAKVVLVVLAVLELIGSATSNLTTLGCDRPTGWCKALYAFLLIVNTGCLVCIFVELCTNNPRLYAPYYVYTLIRAVLACVLFVIALASIGNPSPEHICNACSCYCYSLPDTEHYPGTTIDTQRFKQLFKNVLPLIYIVSYFLAFWWYILLITLIHLAVPEAMRFTQQADVDEQPVAEQV